MNIFGCLPVSQARVPQSACSELIDRKDQAVSQGKEGIGKRITHRKIKQCDICGLRFTGRVPRFVFLGGRRFAIHYEPEVEGRSTIQVLSCKVLSRWVSKPEGELICHEKAIGKINSAAFLLIKKLCDQKYRFHFCSLPSILIMTGASSYWFVETMRTAIERLRIEHKDVCELIERSDGLLKTPLIVTPYNGDCFDPSKLEKITPDFYFYKAVDFMDSSGSALITLYVTAAPLSLDSFLDDLKQSLIRAVECANEHLPLESESRMMIHQYLKSDISFPSTP